MFIHCHCFIFLRTTDADEHFVAYKVNQTKTETLYYTGLNENLPNSTKAGNTSILLST